MSEVVKQETQTHPEEVVVTLPEPFVDVRGLIQPLVDVAVESCVLIESKAGSVRANHYHKTDWHYCYVLQGQIEYYHRPHGRTEEPEKLIIHEKEMFFTPEMVDHAMVFPVDTVFLAFGRNSRKQEVYEADVVRIDPINL